MSESPEENVDTLAPRLGLSLNNFQVSSLQVEIDDSTRRSLFSNIVPAQESTSNHLENVPVTTVNKLGYTEAETSNYIYQVLSKTKQGENQLRGAKCDAITSSTHDSETLIKSGYKKYFSVSKTSALIIKYELGRTNSQDVSGERLNTLAKESAALFGYVEQTFYTAPQDGYRQGGSLSLALRRMKEEYKNQESILFPEADKPTVVTCKKNKKRKSYDFDPSEDFLELKTPVDSINNIYIQNWSNKALQERYKFYSEETLEIILNTFTNLKKEEGKFLIKADYYKLYQKQPVDTQKYLQSWTVVAQNVIKNVKRKENPEVEELLAYLDVSNQENVRTLAFMVLPYLFKKVNKVSKKNLKYAPWTPNHKEVLNSFIHFVKVDDLLIEHVHAAVCSVLELHNKHGLMCAPYIIVSGPSLNEIKTVHVIIDGDIKYSVASCSLGVELCLQIFKVFGKRPSVIHDHIWHFLEHMAFGIPLPKRIPQIVTAVINLLKEKPVTNALPN